MLAIHWSADPRQRESLAVSVRNVLARAGADHSYEEIVSVLGLGAAIVAAADENLAGWPTQARDTALLISANVLGLRLRGLHPPEATEGLTRSAEFPQHFRDSYVPLMRAALESDQPLLVWRGWPPPAEQHWGVIVDIPGETLSGYTIGDIERKELIGPAHQVYVVEEFRQPVPPHATPTALFTHTLSVARDTWNGNLATTQGIETGRRACQLWQEVTRQPRNDALQSEYVSQMINVLVDARRALSTWLRQIADSLPTAQQQAANEWATVCERVIARLRPFISEQDLQAKLAETAGREELAAAINDVCHLETDLYTKLAGGL